MRIVLLTWCFGLSSVSKIRHYRYHIHNHMSGQKRRILAKSKKSKMKYYTQKGNDNSIIFIFEVLFLVNPWSEINSSKQLSMTCVWTSARMDVQR
jgi:hypothetical protein